MTFHNRSSNIRGEEEKVRWEDRDWDLGPQWMNLPYKICSICV
jgi:hypothetical protein